MKTIPRIKGGNGPADAEAEENNPQGDDKCLGSRETIMNAMRKVATIMILASPVAGRATHEWIRNSPYASDYGIISNAFNEMFQIIDQVAADLSGRRNKCRNLSDVAWGWMGLKDCKRGEEELNGTLGILLNFFNQHLGNTRMYQSLAQAGGIIAIFTTLRDFIAKILTNIMCATYYNGYYGTIGTWRISKIIISTSLEFIKNNGIMGANVAIGFGAEILRLFMSVGRPSEDDSENVVEEDTPYIEDVQRNINGANRKTLRRLTRIVDDIEDIEENENEGDAIITNYMDDDEQQETDFQDNDEKLDFMSEYLINAIDETNVGGPEYEDHIELKKELLYLSGRWREDMGIDVEDMPASQPELGAHNMDDEFNLGPMITRTSTYGGVIDKDDKKFIKNMTKSMKTLLAKYKFNKKAGKSKKSLTHKSKAGYNYKKRGTKKKKGRHNSKRVAGRPFNKMAKGTKKRKPRITKKSKTKNKRRRMNTWNDGM